MTRPRILVEACVDATRLFEGDADSAAWEDHVHRVPARRRALLLLSLMLLPTVARAQSDTSQTIPGRIIRAHLHTGDPIEGTVLGGSTDSLIIRRFRESAKSDTVVHFTDISRIDEYTRAHDPRYALGGLVLGTAVGYVAAIQLAKHDEAQCNAKNPGLNGETCALVYVGMPYVVVAGAAVGLTTGALIKRGRWFTIWEPVPPRVTPR